MFLYSVLVVSCEVIPMSAFGQILEWKSYTSVGAIKDIAIGGGNVWSGSNGGVLQLHTSNLDITKITNTEGLASNEVTAVEIDQHGSVWFALFDGVLNRYLPEQDEWEVVEDYKGQVITDVVAFGDSLYIGLNIGVSLYTIDKREVKETYTNLGFSTGGNVEKVAANSVFLNGRDIWVSTDRGIAQSSIDLPNLQAPASWRQYTTANGLPTNQINKVVVLDSTPYAATSSGVSRLVNGVWSSTGLNGMDVRGIDIVKANQFFLQNTVVSFVNFGVFYLNASDQWQQLGSNFGEVTAVKTDDEGAIWTGRKDQGLARFSVALNDWELFETNSPASNNFTSIALDSKGRLWCASQERGVHVFDGVGWTNFSTENGLKNNDQRTVVVDSQDRVWFGSWGGGITIFEETTDGFNITQIDNRDGILAGFPGDPNFVLVNWLDVDQSGNVWILNREAVTTRILVTHTLQDEWIYFSRTELTAPGETQFTPFVMTIEIDDGGRVWIGTEANGIKVLDHNNTLADNNDDNVSQGLTVSGDDLLSDRINALAEDRDGVMWIGTDQGVNFWFGNRVGNQFGVINNFINAIGVDARNNKWFGTPSGISVLGRDGVIRDTFTTGNSPLVSSNVISFAFDEETGDIWIGTTNGLSRVKTPFTAPKPDLTLLTGFPNPFRLNDSIREFTITNLAENTTVVIYNGSGKRIRRFDASEIQGAQVFWDGRDEKNNLVPSGVYVFLAFVEGGISATGKVAVIRE
jgi:ligand-binding sensor domain-containing protein